MIGDDVQKQQAGDHSTNLQGRAIVVHQGISYSDAKEIALDVYKANFLQLSQSAAELAIHRAEELTDKFLTELKERSPAALEKMQDPAMQMALFTAQREYARTGDKDLEGLLVDILIDRAGQDTRTLQQVVLDESLTVAPKLNTEQLSALTVNFLLTQTRNHSILNLATLQDYLDTHLIPFTSDLSKDTSCYEHLEYAGCGSVIHVGNLHSVEEFFRRSYPGLFCKGVNEEDLAKVLGDRERFAHFLMASLHDPKMIQVNAMDTDVIKQMCEKRAVPEEDQKKLITLFNKTRMDAKEVKERLLQLRPQLEHLFDVWSNSGISHFSLTTVGIAIAQANFRRKTGIRLNLSIWVK